MTDATEPAFQRLDATLDPHAAAGPGLQATTGLDLPLWTQNGSYGAVLDRLAIETLLTAGVRFGTDLAVSQRAAGANLSVDVAAGVCAITGTDTANQGRYLCRATAVNNLVINGPPPAGQTRIDRIVARVYDAAIIGGSTNGWSIEVVQGTPGSSPSAPALPASSLALARVTVPAGLASVTAANITDDRIVASTPKSVVAYSEYVGGNYAPGATAYTNGQVVPLPAGFTLPGVVTDASRLYRVSINCHIARVTATGQPAGQFWAISPTSDGATIGTLANTEPSPPDGLAYHTQIAGSCLWLPTTGVHTLGVNLGKIITGTTSIVVYATGAKWVGGGFQWLVEDIGAR